MPELYGPLDSLEAKRKLLEERRARLLAAAKRATPMPEGQMVSGHYVPPSWTQYLPGLLNQYQTGADQRQIEADSLAQGVTEKAALRDSLAQLSGTPGEAATPFGSRDMPQQDAVQAVPAPTGADRRAIIAQLMDNPAAGALGGELLKDDLISAPIRAEAIQQKNLDREDRQVEAKTALEANLELRREQLAQQAAATKLASEDRRLSIEQRREAAQMHAQLMAQLQADRLAARANAPEKSAKPVNLTAAQQKAYDEADALIGQIDTTLAAVKANPNAVGFKTVIPDMALSKFDPEGVQTRAAVAGLSAEKVHQLSGAAVSPAEFARLRPYMPASGDTAKAVQAKLANLKSELERIRAIHARGPTRATGGASGSWGETKAPAGISLPPGFKYVGPAQ